MGLNQTLDRAAWLKALEAEQSRKEGGKLLVEVAKSLLAEIGSGSDLGYHLDCKEFGGQLRQALTLLGEINDGPNN